MTIAKNKTIAKKNTDSHKRNEVQAFQIPYGPVFEGVKIVDKNYLSSGFRFRSPVECNIIKKTVSQFNLNSDQEHAFHIVGNHVCCESSEQLMMYMGGGASGAGKSHVLKAMVHFFIQRGETGRILVLGPTGMQLPMSMVQHTIQLSVLEQARKLMIKLILKCHLSIMFALNCLVLLIYL